ncbi:MAG: carboxylating nicotinate-nucleotide diphosphorylase [Cellvibrionaceae bacterium]|nr:carboxylating nicotinate-nucleotide diphosphorylase [Cellvibrionaceae bacterium]
MNIELKNITADIQRAVADALHEDIGTGDITAELLAADTISNATVITREPCVVCGIPWFDEVFRQLDPAIQIQWHVEEGQSVAANTQLASLKGRARSLVTGERSALNFLQLLSGTATQSRELAKLVSGTKIQILDTRKTIPGLRTAQKYAVAVGGCHNHRIGLYDAFLIKENHITACGGISSAITRAQQLHPEKPIIVEVENYEEFREAASHPVTRIMLDNFSAEDLQKVSAHPSAVPVEISGNITATEIAKLAHLKISAISTGSLTKHVRAVDLSMRIV